MRMLLSAVIYLAANAVGLLIAILLLPGFRIDPLSFIVVVVVFSLVQAVLGPIVRKVSEKRVPQLMGGIALVIIFLVLFVTDLAMGAMEIGGISNWLAATLLVWLGSLVAGLVLQKRVLGNSAETPDRR